VGDLRKLVDVTGIEPATPCLQRKLGEITKCFVWCRLHGKSAKFPLSQMSRSCTEVPAEFSAQLQPLAELRVWHQVGPRQLGQRPR
jgi:hypothetical protein